MTSPDANDRTGPDLRGTHALITGASGFLGTSLARRLVAAGATVTGIDRLAAPGVPDAPCASVDVTDLGQLVRAFNRCALPDARRVIVFHLAGMAHVGRCRENPADAFAQNVTATSNVLEACRRAEIRRLVFPSTALVYALAGASPLDEGAPTAPRSVYAATKLAAEAIIRGWASTFGFDATILRLGNVYGEGSTPDSIVSLIMQQVRSGGPVRVRTLAPVRDFVYREDVIGGMVAVAAQPFAQGGRVLNLSSGAGTSIAELAVVACRIAGLTLAPQATAPQERDSDDHCVLSIRRLSEYAHWHPFWSLEAGLRRVLSTPLSPAS